MFLLNPWNAREASHHAAFMGNWSTIIHTFLVLPTQWMSSPLRKCECGVSPRFHLLVQQVANQGIWPKSREMGGRGAQDSILESFSADLPAIDSYCTDHQRRSSSVKAYWAQLGDWDNGRYVDGLLHVWWVAFSSLGSWSYFKEWVWSLGTRLQ